MKNTIGLVITVLVLIVSTNTAVADDYWDDQPYSQSGEPNYRYESDSGQQYQYDLSEPTDRILYEADIPAQLRDATNYRPLIQIDRESGQAGGGARR